MEECDDGGLLLGCTSACKLAECQRVEAAARPLGEEDMEMETLWMEAYRMPSPPSSDLLAMQGYKLCFNFSGPDSSVPRSAFAGCAGASRLTFVVAGRNGSDADMPEVYWDRIDVDFGSEVFDAEPGTVRSSGPHQLRVRQHGDGELGDHELILSCRVGFEVWDACVLWAVREGSPGSARTRHGESTGAEARFLIYTAPESADWRCDQRSVPHCGDGHLTGQEECDDGNKDDADGCSERCTVESGFLCPLPGLPCYKAVCGDGVAGPRHAWHKAAS